ncbi:ephrin-B2-like [Mercenaria mercenaria]|uniref:ephrin-B2-like n=1 Tax=Mercenaria mercenaria TaxID=6596 RepID=UPI00234F59E1|nr:ephrin-B2-like [Mercenaria mercenaria]
MNLGVLKPKLSRIMPVAFQYIWILPLCMGTMISVVDTEKTVIAWNRSNQLFQTEGGAHLTLPILTNLMVLCPCNTTPSEYYRVYWVAEEGYRRCFLTHNDSQMMVDCVNPHEKVNFTQEIRTFSGVPGGKDFKIGSTYYLATFSTGTQNGLLNEEHGACKDHNLRLKVTITGQITHSTQKPTNTPASTTRKSTPSPTTRTTKYTTRSTTKTTTQSTTTKQTTQTPRTTDIPDLTDIPVISVPDTPGGNTGVIDISSAQTLRVSLTLVLSVCLSLLHILYLNVPLIQR